MFDFDLGYKWILFLMASVGGLVVILLMVLMAVVLIYGLFHPKMVKDICDTIHDFRSY